MNGGPSGLATKEHMDPRTHVKVVETTRFGKIEVDEDRVVHFPEGLLGFPQQRDYAILDHKPGSPFHWLQSLDVPELAFVMIDPFAVREDYLKDLTDQEKDPFKGRESRRPLIFALATIPAGKVEQMTVNLLGPIVIDAEMQVGRQIVLANSAYHTRHPVFPSKR